MKTLHEDVALLSDTTPFSIPSARHIASARDKVHWVQQSHQYNGEPSHVMLHESGCLPCALL